MIVDQREILLKEQSLKTQAPALMPESQTLGFESAPAMIR